MKISSKLLACLCVLAGTSVAGCYPVRNPPPPGPAADTALNRGVVAPVRDPADDPDTASPVEANDPPGDAGSYSPGSDGFGRLDRPAAEPVRIGPPPGVLDARRRAGDGDIGGRNALRQRQAQQRRDLEARACHRPSCCLPANPRAEALVAAP